MSEMGKTLATAIATKDAGAVRTLLAAGVDFKALTPGRFWEAHTSEEVLDAFFGHWFDAGDEIKSLLACQTGSVGTRESVTYRLHVTHPDEQFEVEQQAYFNVVDGRISFL